MMQGSLTGSMGSRSQSGDHNGEETNLGNSGEKMNQDKDASPGKVRKEIRQFGTKTAPSLTQGNTGKPSKGLSLPIAAAWAKAH